MIKVLINGAKGKMGVETVKAVSNDSELELVGTIDFDDNLSQAITDLKPDVVVDFTNPDSVKGNTLTILNSGCYAVIGTTGLSEKDLMDLEIAALENKTAVLVCPNFAIGAVLMMQFAAQAAKHMPRCEIIEMHHDKKIDAPSGTAIKTAELICESNPQINVEKLKEKEIVLGSRGGNKHNIPIHAIRLPGFVANQEVIFGGLGQTLHIKHDTISRESFMPGVILSIKKAQSLKGLVYGLENLL